MRDEFRKLFHLLAEAQQGKQVDLGDMLKESLAFFEHLKEIFKSGSEEEKKETVKIMNDLYAQLMTQMKRVCERTGMSEDQLFSFCDNPNNFTAEQWQVMEEAKKRLFQSGRELTDQVRHAKDGKGGSHPKLHKGGKHPPKKDQWQKS